MSVEELTRDLTEAEVQVLGVNRGRKKRLDEFVDEWHEASIEFYELLDLARSGELGERELQQQMKGLVDKDPKFLDPYLWLAEAATTDDGKQLWTSDAYVMAVKRVCDHEGNYPIELLWGWTENRHIIRALSNFGVCQWRLGQRRVAIEIFRRLLASNPGDNIGARYHILALRLGLDPDYENQFLPDSGPVFGLDASKLDDWYESHSPKFAEEFTAVSTFE